MDFKEKDLKLFKDLNISLASINSQIELFEKGMVYLDLIKPALIGEGILRLEDNEQERLLVSYNDQVAGLDIIKFVPASGAATRMFKDLFHFLNVYDYKAQSLSDYLEAFPLMADFFLNLSKLPFYDEMINYNNVAYPGYDCFDEGKKAFLFVDTLLNSDKFNYGNMPKALIPFHIYEHGIRNAFIEQIFEGIEYLKGDGELVSLHFTVSELFFEYFETELDRVKSDIENNFGVTLNISFSFQNQNTNTLAVNTGNLPYYSENGELLLRPGGHGALLDNLNSLKSDIVFIKNIDNISPTNNHSVCVRSKKVLAAYLLEMQESVFKYLNLIKDSKIDLQLLSEIENFMADKLNVCFGENYGNLLFDKKQDYLFALLNRPIRVCGMVLNEGQSGGGPFWALNKNGLMSLQIVESAQIDMSLEKNIGMMAKSTHFNPVDIVCGLKNFKGELFNLYNYVDDSKVFISNKTYGVDTIKCLELPGLWNGSMDDWITIFVEVLLSTFTPVKTVSDLLKKTHQN